MKWGNVCILNLEPEDSTINLAAKGWKDRYSVPDHRCFNLGDLQPGFIEATTSCLRPSVCTLSTKLMIFAHGDEFLLKVWTPFQLGDVLCNFFGLREVGLMTFKSCEVGKGNYLENLLYYVNMRSVKVGWLLGYKHSTLTFEGPRGVVREVVQDEELEDLQLLESGAKLSDDKRVKILKGNTDVVPAKPSLRYR